MAIRRRFRSQVERNVEHGASGAADQLGFEIGRLLEIRARGDGVGLEKIPQDQAVRMLTEAPEPGFDYYGAQFERAIRAIAAGGCWRLMLSGDPDAAIATLIAAFAERTA